MTKRTVVKFRREVGNIIREAREKAGLSQVKLAKKLRIPDRSLRIYEKGQATMGWIKFVEICTVLGIDPGSALTSVINKVNGR